MANNTSIYFQFKEKKGVFQAFDTLQELGYEVEWIEQSKPETIPILQINVHQSDIISAIEISQAHGGVLVNRKKRSREEDEGYDHFPVGVHL